ncbi:unnamed protein product [Brachionus calyciflorus]|uniref:Uncharacterized protein n=1 Tax=Brachionus calyciflorus TaxID=104777 RepID=A0A813ZZF6_9BILA|nr:unnamed protein product [Brachionus calyciflorus]
MILGKKFKKLVKKPQFFLILILIILIIYTFKIENLREKFSDNIWYKIFKRYYEFNGEYYDDANPKYILYECVELCGGWADRLKGLFSIYAWSLITKRNFRIYLTHPCNLESLVKPNKIKWNSPMIHNGIDIQKSKKFTTSHLDFIDDLDFKKNIQFIDINEIESQTNLLVVNDNQDWTYGISRNDYLSEQIKNLGYEDQEKFNLVHLFRDWFKNMFNLSDQLEIKYEAIKKQFDLKNNKVVCAQIRIGGARPNVAFDYQYNSRNVTQLFWNFIREKFLSQIEDDNYKIFITTDLESVYKEAEIEFGIDSMIHIPGLYTHIDREQYLKDNCERVDKTVLDFYFFENCDYVLISNSGFGKLGSLRKKDPFKNAFILKNDQFQELTEDILIGNL